MDLTGNQSDKSASQIHGHASRWFLDGGQGPIGPFASSEIYQMYMGGEILSDSKLWKQGDQAWRRLNEIDDLWSALNPNDKNKSTKVANDSLGYSFDPIPALPKLHDLDQLPSFPKPPESLRKAWLEKYKEDWNQNELQFETEKFDSLVAEDLNAKQSSSRDLGEEDVLALTEMLIETAVVNVDKSAVPPPIPEETFIQREEVVADLSVNDTVAPDLNLSTDNMIDATSELVDSIADPDEMPVEKKSSIARRLLSIASLAIFVSLLLLAGIVSLRFMPQFQFNKVSKLLTPHFKQIDLNRNFFESKTPNWKAYLEARTGKIYVVSNMIGEYQIALKGNSVIRDNLGARELSFQSSGLLKNHVVVLDQIKYLKGVNLEEGHYLINVNYSARSHWALATSFLNTVERFINRRLIADPSGSDFYEKEIKLNISHGVEQELINDLANHQQRFDAEVMRPLEMLQENYKTIAQAIDWSVARAEKLSKVNNAARIFLSEYDKKFGPLVQGLLKEYQSQKVKNFKGDLDYLENWGGQFVDHLKRFGQSIAGLQDNFQLRPNQRSSQDVALMRKLKSDVQLRIAEIDRVRKQNLSL